MPKQHHAAAEPEAAPKPRKPEHAVEVQILQHPYTLPARLKDAYVDPQGASMYLSFKDAVYAVRNLSWVNIDFSKLTEAQVEAFHKENIGR